MQNHGKITTKPLSQQGEEETKGPRTVPLQNAIKNELIDKISDIASDQPIDIELTKLTRKEKDILFKTLIDKAVDDAQNSCSNKIVKNITNDFIDLSTPANFTDITFDTSLIYESQIPETTSPEAFAKTVCSNLNKYKDVFAKQGITILLEDKAQSKTQSQKNTQTYELIISPSSIAKMIDKDTKEVTSQNLRDRIRKTLHNIYKKSEYIREAIEIARDQVRSSKKVTQRRTKRDLKKSIKKSLELGNLS